MFENKSSTKGIITFAEEVIATIAGIAAVGVSGVAGMSGGIVDGIAEFLGKKSPVKGVKVESDNGDVIVNLQVVAEYGISMPAICDTMQDNIKNDIERMTGLKVKSVNVNVQGIRLNKEEAAATPANNK